MYSFKSLVDESNLRSLMQLAQACRAGIDFNTVDDLQIKKFIQEMGFDEPPESSLIQKKGIMKRDSGMLGGFKECTVVLTRDHYLYGFDWSLV
jgi:hypothetical protein